MYVCMYVCMYVSHVERYVCMYVCMLSMYVWVEAVVRVCIRVKKCKCQWYGCSEMSAMMSWKKGAAAAAITTITVDLLLRFCFCCFMMLAPYICVCVGGYRWIICQWMWWMSFDVETCVQVWWYVSTYVCMYVYMYIPTKSSRRRTSSRRKARNGTRVVHK